MNEFNQRQDAESQRFIQARAEQLKAFEEKKKQDEEARARDEQLQLEKKDFDDKRFAQQRGAEEARHFEEKRRAEKKTDEMRRRRGESMSATASGFDDEKPESNEQDVSKAPEGEKEGIGSDVSADLQEPGKGSADEAQTPFAEPVNKPLFATPKPEDPKLEKPYTLAERTAIRNMEKALENERAGHTRPPVHTVERAEQAEAKLRESTATSKTKKAEHSQSHGVEKTW